jgi:cobalt/nickel transport system ATP-binding protein
MTDPAPPHDPPVFRLEGVTFRYADDVLALDGVGFEVRTGEAVCLLGANGCGKSTLLRLLDGLCFPTAGRIEAWGRPLVRATLEDEGFLREFRRRTALLFQDPDVQLFSPTVLDEIAFGPLQLGLAEEQVRARCRDLLALAGLDRLAGRPPHALSGGEKKQVAIAAALATDPEVLLLDEPFSALDPRSQVWLVELLQALRDRGKTIIAATHDLSVVEEIAERAIVFGEDHRIAADARVPDVLGDAGLLLRVNLVHEHAHRHGKLVHSHPHGHGHDHGHG